MYRKFTADYIFTGYEILQKPMALVTDPSGVIIDIVDPEDAGDGIEILNGLLSPGFVNAHCHLELSHLNGMIPEKTGLVHFVQEVMSRRAASRELKMEAMINAEAEMYKNGIIAVGDICNTTDSIPVKQQSKLLWHNFIEVSGFSDASAPIRLQEMKMMRDQFNKINVHQRATLSPHAPYSVSKTLFQLLNDETRGQLITIHNQECAAEDDLYLQQGGGFLQLYKNFEIDISTFEPTGKTSFQSWLPLFTKHQSIISVHNTFTSEADMAFLNSHPPGILHQLYYCICINANQYVEQKTPPVSDLVKNNCTIIIGTDSYASNHQLNILEEIKSIQHETNHVIPLPDILQWSTLNGAKALQLDHIAGSFEKGKKPGIVLIEGLNNLQTNPQSFSRRLL